ncbi:MAG TPA: sigma-70 family RNA polymerase sigma factor [Candidatus Nanoarchaeia archaeon]|nr:sigma-70 family RNA polymerase sigma factor [Candidatus Nanoarchaeia archaeon]
MVHALQQRYRDLGGRVEELLPHQKHEANRGTYHNQLIARIRKEGPQSTAWQALLEDNQGLLVNLANKYSLTDTPVDDLIQAGEIGIFRAVQRYNPRKGRFTTYAGPWVRKEMMHCVNVYRRACHIPHGRTHYNIALLRGKKIPRDADERQRATFEYGIMFARSLGTLVPRGKHKVELGTLLASVPSVDQGMIPHRGIRMPTIENEQVVADLVQMLAEETEATIEIFRNTLSAQENLVFSGRFVIGQEIAVLFEQYGEGKPNNVSDEWQSLEALSKQRTPKVTKERIRQIEMAIAARACDHDLPVFKIPRDGYLIDIGELWNRIL